jgi:methionyl-tRNA formyltransferase
MIRLALFTSQDIGFDLVQYFAERSDIDLLVISYEQAKDAGYGYRSALTFCREWGIKHIEALKAGETVAIALDQHRPDIILSAYYAKILPLPLLAKARMGGINVHPGKLPYYKGRFPTPWYILNGDQTFGIALHKMVDAVDAGDVFVQREFPIPDEMTGHELLRETMKRSAEVIKDSFDAIVSGSLKPKPQVSGGSQYDHIDKEYQIDWSLPAEMIVRQIRVHAPPYKPAFGLIEGRQISISKAKTVSICGRSGSLISEEPLIIGCGVDAIACDHFDWQ